MGQHPFCQLLEFDQVGLEPAKGYLDPSLKISCSFGTNGDWAFNANVENLKFAGSLKLSCLD